MMYGKVVGDGESITIFSRSVKTPHDRKLSCCFCESPVAIKHTVVIFSPTATK